MIQFGAPALLLTLAVVAAMLAGLVWSYRWQRQARADFAGPQAARWPRTLAGQRTLLLLLAAALVAIAAARPQWGSREFNREREGVDLVIALDISQSMQATDVGQSRLALAQAELVSLVEAQRGSRIGLVFFAGSAIIRSPLTTDTQTMVQLIRRADREAGLTRTGSDIGAALEQAARILEGSETAGLPTGQAGKAVLVVSDGEDHVDAYAQRIPPLLERGVVVFSAGAGTPEGGTIAETDPRTGLQRVKLDAQGRPVITRLDESSLRDIAQRGGGRYLRLGPDSLVSLRDDLTTLQQTPLGAETQRIPIERFQLFAAAGFALLIASWLMPERLSIRVPRRLSRLRPAPGVAMVVLALLIGACGSDSLRDKNSEANRLYEEGDFEAALTAYEELLAQRPDVPELSLNAGNTLNRLGSYERAVGETRRALPPTTTGLGAVTYYALGNHFFSLNQLDDAYSAYRSSLLLDPKDEDAKFNLELTLLRLQAQQQPGGEGPGPGQQPQPGEQPGQPNQPGPAPGTPSPGATPQPSPAELQRSLQEALRGLDDDLTFEEAVRILQLLRQQQERQRPGGQPGAPSGPDY